LYLLFQYFSSISAVGVPLAEEVDWLFVSSATNLFDAAAPLGLFV
jgi:hypothetical protein